MTTEEAKMIVLAQINERGKNYRTGVYQEYAIKELGFKRKKAEKFAAEFDNFPLSNEFKKYHTPAEIDRVYFWYYINYCAQFFCNGFPEWLQVHHLIIQYLQNSDIKPAAPSVKEAQEENKIDIYYLAEKLTNEFELRYRGQDWDRKDMDKAIIEFCNEKNLRN